MKIENTGQELLFVATNDIAARTKGRAMLMDDFSERSSLGWVPANLGIGPLGHIVDDIPFGSSGDLRLLPDTNSLTRIEGIGEKPPLNIVFADLVEPDGKPWGSCQRTFLKQAVAELAEKYGLKLKVTFEHEFVDISDEREHHPFSLEEFRRAEPVGTQLMNVLDSAGLEPETWLPEYGRHQFEVTLRPTDPVTAADRAILVREIVYDVFEQAGKEASFAPTVAPGSAGNGVHVHFGITDLDGNPVCFDADKPGRLSERAAKFAAGIIKYAPAMAALFAPLVTSYERLAPHNWSTARSFLGLQNREALLRIPPTNELDGRDPAPQLHFEFRASDIGANPWLLLGILIRAGMQGFSENLPAAEVIVGELDLEGAHKSLAELPRDLNNAIDMLLADPVVSGWFTPEFLATFAAIKRDEFVFLKGRSAAEQCEVYTSVY